MSISHDLDIIVKFMNTLEISYNSISIIVHDDMQYISISQPNNIDIVINNYALLIALSPRIAFKPYVTSTNEHECEVLLLIPLDITDHIVSISETFYIRLANPAVYENPTDKVFTDISMYYRLACYATSPMILVHDIDASLKTNGKIVFRIEKFEYEVIESVNVGEAYKELDEESGIIYQNIVEAYRKILDVCNI
jgi:hypothetical protein